MVRVTLATLLAYSLAGCGPVRQNPIGLLPFNYNSSYEVRKLPVQWVTVTAAPPPAKTSKVTTSIGATPVGITMGGYDVPTEQLLTEQEQRQIVRILKDVIGEASESSCVATIAFDDLAYEFHGHQYWVTVTLSIVNGETEILHKSERIWSAEGMSASQRLSTHPQSGKQALARQILDRFGSYASHSAGDLSVCAP